MAPDLCKGHFQWLPMDAARQDLHRIEDQLYRQ